MTPEVQAALLNTYPPKLVATILKALREQLNEDDQLNAVEEVAGFAPEIPFEFSSILKDGGGFRDDEDGGYLPDDRVLAARREEIAWVHSEDVYEINPMQECTNAGKKLLDLIWVGRDKSVCTRSQEIRSTVCQTDKTKRQGKIQRALPPSPLFSAMPPLEAEKVLVPIMMSVGWLSKGKPLKLRLHDISRAPSKEQPRDSSVSVCQRKIDISMVYTKLAS